MTDEDPAGTPPAENRGRGRGPAPAPVELLTVVAFARHDEVTGTDQTVVGVVVETDDQALTVRPLAGHLFRVSRDDVTVVGAGEDEPV